MKYFYQMILVYLLCLTVNSSAQCVRGIRTNPNDPLNPDFELVYPGLENPFINRFDWAKNNGLSFETINLNPNVYWDVSTYGMVNPFSMYMPAEYRYLWTSNGKLVPIDELDWHWENGWELMALNTGYYPDGTELNNPNPKSILNMPMLVGNSKVPYFMLYNRYTGKLRVFGGLFTPFGSVQNIYMMIRYDIGNGVSGIFRSLGNYDRPMDYPSKHIGVTTYNKNFNNKTTWFSSDVQLSYDPCVCNYATTMQFSFDAIKTFDVNLYGREITVPRTLDVAPSDFLNQTSINQYSSDGNNLLYKELDKMYADYQQQLLDYDIKMKDYNSIRNQIKRSIIGIARDGFTNGVAGLIKEDAIKRFLIQHNFKLFGKEFPDTNTAEGWSKLAREGAKGLAGEGFDYLSQTLIGKDNKPVAPTMPTATFSEMRISGKIDQTNIIHVGNIYTPGSYNPEDKLPLHSPHYPIYNEAVGLFALLERPSFDLFHQLQYDDVRERKTDYVTSKLTTDGKRSYDTVQVPGVRNYVAHTATYLKLNAPLKFRFNHAVDFNWDKTNVYVSFEVEYYTNYGWIKEGTTLDRFDSMSYTYTAGNFELLHMYDSEVKIHKRSYNSKWIPIEDIGQQVLGIEFTDSLTQQRGEAYSMFYYSTPQVKALWPPRIRRIKMKLMADMYFNQLSYQGGEINTTQVFTYLIYDTLDAESVTSSKTDIASKQNIAKYTLGEIVLDSQEVSVYSPYVTSVSNNELVMDAEHVKIIGDISVAPGYKLFIRSFNEIEVSPQAILSPEINLEIKRDFYSVAKTLEVKDEELKEFCKGDYKKYQAGTTLTKQEEQDTETIEEDDKTYPYLNSQIIRVYPNPASDGMNINFEHVEDGRYTITLVNVLGREYVFENVDVNGRMMHYINTSNFPDGMYFLKIAGPAHTVRERILIKQ